MKQELEQKVIAAAKELFNAEVAVDLARPDEQHGDYATNVALQLARQLNKSPREIAEAIAVKLRETLTDQVNEVTVAGPGFINVRLSDTALLQAAQSQPAKTLQEQTIVAEYSDPNPFKVLHVGHVYTTVVGDAIANLMELAGAHVHRVNYGGDVGLHVGKTMWAILQRLGGEYAEKLQEIAPEQRPQWMAEAYVAGNNAYEQDEQTKQAIIELNKRVYKLHADNDHESPFAQIYWTCRQWSYAAFDAFYARMGTKMERYYPESEVADEGLRLVREHVGDVFKESDGAIVFDGESHGLHTRVFINQQGLPTYEAKEVGLIVRKHQDYHFDRSVIVTANEQEQYMTVVLKAIEHFMPELARATTHIPHGMVKLAGGVKMSSRLGNIISANDVLEITAQANRELVGNDSEETVQGAIKYAFLKTRIGGDLIYEPRESVSLEGNSGPYLQYAHARARSILRKAEHQSMLPQAIELQPGERTLVRKLSEYTEVANRAVNELMPHHIATYLYELAQSFNRFYEHNRVIGDERQEVRLGLVQHYADTLAKGLNLLGISAPDTM